MTEKERERIRKIEAEEQRRRSAQVLEWVRQHWPSNEVVFDESEDCWDGCGTRRVHGRLSPEPPRIEYTVEEPYGDIPAPKTVVLPLDNPEGCRVSKHGALIIMEDVSVTQDGVVYDEVICCPNM